MFIVKAGEIRVRGISKRHWNECPESVKRTIQSYIDLGWSLLECHSLTTKEISVQLERCDTDLDSPIAWHHSKKIRVAPNGKITLIQNGKSFTTDERETEEPIAEEPPKRQRRKAKETEGQFKPNPLTYFDVAEFGKTVEWFLETTEVWSYGEGCDCGCKFVAQSRTLRANQTSEERHFETLESADRFFRSL